MLQRNVVQIWSCGIEVNDDGKLFFLIQNQQQILEFFVENKNKISSSSSEDIGECSLEEGRWSFLFGNLHPAVKSVFVHHVRFSPARLHHHTPSDSIEWIGGNTRYSCDSLKIKFKLNFYWMNSKISIFFIFDQFMGSGMKDVIKRGSVWCMNHHSR